MLVEIQLVQTISQFGAVGIIIYLVLWLTRIQIPSQQKEREAERKARLAELESQHEAREEIIQAHAEQAKQQRDDYLSSLKEIEARVEREATECRKERQEQAALSRQERELDRQARHELGNLLQRAINEMHEARQQSPNPAAPRDNDRRPD